VAGGVAVGLERARLAELVRGARSVVALTGAGISVPSGIPDFRTPRTGLWETVDPMQVAHIDAFRSDPVRFWDFYGKRFATLGAKEPNGAHGALVAMERAGMLEAVITQNIDMLHRKAGTRELIEVHGSIESCSCPSCGESVSREQARFLFEADVRASPQEVWDAMTDPAAGMRWRVGVDDIRERNPGGGRGVGTVTHCVHGGTTIEQEIVDWLPPRHYTFRERNPAGACEWTVSLAPLDEDSATHIEWRVALRGGRGQALLMRLVGRKMGTTLQANFDALLAHVGHTAVA